jgi:DNA-binding transcriptional LysR family regulator
MDGRVVDDIATFVAVVDANGFAAGGRTLGLSRSAAGKAVARLEARLGARLLNRSTRSLSLTDDGHDLYRQGMAIAAALDQMEASLVRNVSVPQGVLRLTAPDAFGRKAVLPVVSAFLDRWPDVQVEIGFSDTVVSMIDEGFDLAIRIGVTSPSPGLIMRVLRKENVLLCAAPAYLDRRGRPEDIEQLDDHDLLFHARHNERQNWMLRQPDGSVNAGRGRSRLRLDSASAIQDAAIAGMGIALLPHCLVETDITRGTLCHVLPEATPEPVSIVALYPHRRHLDGKVRHFIDDLATSLQARS